MTFKVDKKKRKGMPDVNCLRLYFQSPSDQEMIERLRALAGKSDVTPTEVVRQMILHCLGSS